MAEKKEKKGKKGIMGIVTIILVPILIVVLLASFLFAIIDAIIELIKELIGKFLRSIIDLLKNPVKWVKAKWSQFENWWSRNFWESGFNPENYEQQGRIDPTIVISNDAFNEMKTSLEKIIDRNSAGLDDIMLKKMLLTYYRGIYLDDTTVLIELTEEDINTINVEYEDLPEKAKEMKYKKDDERGYLLPSDDDDARRLTKSKYNNLSKENKSAIVWVSLFETKAYRGDAIEDIGSGAAAGAAIGAMIGGGPGAIVGGIFGGLFGAHETEVTIRTLLDEDGKEWLEEHCEKEFFPYEIVGGDTEEGRGEDGRIYLKTTGMIKIYIACDRCNALEEEGNSRDRSNCDICDDNKIIYFKYDILEKIYENEYLDLLDDCNDACKAGEDTCYAHEVLEYLKKCYCYGAEVTYTENDETGETEVSGQKDCIKMFSERKENDTRY